MGIVGLGIVGLGTVITLHPNTPSDTIAGVLMLIAGFGMLYLNQTRKRS